MTRPGRRIILRGLSIVLIIIFAATLRLGWEWKQALDNVNAMTIPTVTLPEITPTSHHQTNPVSQDIELQPTAIPATPVPTPDEPVNILLLGIDARIGEEVSRTDAIVVVRIDPQHNSVSMLSLPRDLWVDIPGYGKNKINTAYPLGENDLGPGYGPALAKQTVSDLLDMPIHHFAMINFEGFQTLIDKLDGIEIDVPQEIYDNKYPVDEFEGDLRTMEVHFEAGTQMMDGERALIYARTRHADSDFGRNQRQQQVLLSIFNRVLDKDLFSQMTSLDDYTYALRDYVRFDLSRSKMLSLASIGPRLQTDNIQRYAIDSKMITMVPSESDAFFVDPDELEQLVNDMVSTPSMSAGGESTVKR